MRIFPLNLRITLCVYSGRVDPSWWVNTEELGLSDKFSKLERTTETFNNYVMGYRGLEFDGIFIYSGLIKDGFTYKDEDRKLEKFLFLSSKGQIEDKLFNNIFEEQFSDYKMGKVT